MSTLEVTVSTDKFVVEYTDVPYGYFLGWYARLLLQGKYKVRTIYGKLYCFQLHIRLSKGSYLHLYYCNFNEEKDCLCTLRIETRPEFYEQFADELEDIRSKAREIYFVSCDIAYDVPTPLDKVFVGSYGNEIFWRSSST